MDWRARTQAVEAALTPARLRLLAGLVLAANLLTTTVWLVTARHGLDRFDQPVGGDFIIFHSAAVLTAHGRALAAFSHAALLAQERAAVAGAPAGLWFCYPPPFQLLIAPLGLLPFPVAFAAWSLLGSAAWLAAVRLWTRSATALLLAAAFPGLFVALWQGQTSVFVAAALCAGLALLDRRPLAAGAVLGLLVCKPQFALLLAPLMLFSGRWRALAGMCASAAALCAVSAAALGWDVWAAFVRTLPEVSANMESGALPWAKMPSVFVALRLAGLAREPALAVHAATAGALALAALLSWRRPGPWGPKAALAALAVLLATPYAFNYDLVLLGVAGAALAATTPQGRLPAGAGLALALGFFTPTLFLGPALRLHVQAAPLALILLAWTAWRLDRTPRAPTAGAAAADDARLVAP